MRENKFIFVIGATILIVVLIIFLPGLIEDKKELEMSKLEYNLTLEGKTTSARNITENFVLLLSESKYDEASKYLSKDCKLIDYNNRERAKLEYCLEKLAQYSSYKIEERENSIKDEETYRILWNGTNFEDTNQVITICLKKEINQNEVTYKIYKVIFTDNTLI